jgi:hypothetical protein
MLWRTAPELSAELERQAGEMWAQEYEQRQDWLAQEWAERGDGPCCHRIICPCGKIFFSKKSLAVYCSYRCRNDAYIARRKEWRAEARSKVCTSCDQPFKAKRRDAKYCSDACRQRGFRGRLRNG